jgi:hypothetical protein
MKAQIRTGQPVRRIAEVSSPFINAQVPPGHSTPDGHLFPDVHAPEHQFTATQGYEPPAIPREAQRPNAAFLILPSGVPLDGCEDCWRSVPRVPPPHADLPRDIADGDPVSVGADGRHVNRGWEASEQARRLLECRHVPQARRSIEATGNQPTAFGTES